MFNQKKLLIALIGVCLSLCTDAQTKKMRAPLDDFVRDKEIGAFVYHDISSRENFTDESIFESVPGAAEYIIPEISLPRIRSQGGAPLCQSFCPTVLVEFKYCKQSGFENCRDLTDSKRLSPISLIAYRDNVDNHIKASIGSLSSSGQHKPYEVMNSVSTASPRFFFTEGCAPFDKIMEKFGNDANALENYRLNLQSKFGRIKAKLKDAKASEDSCPECVELMNSLNEGFHSRTNFLGFEGAIENTEFDEFLFDFLFSRQVNSKNETCNQIRLKKKIRANYFPTEPNVSLVQVFEVVTEQLKKQNPVLLSSVCFTKSKIDGRCTAHCLVLTGERKVRNKMTGEIIHLIRVHNSWGKKWQEDHSDGWVRADKLRSIVRTADDELLNNRAEDRRNSFGHTISWFDQD